MLLFFIFFSYVSPLCPCFMFEKKNGKRWTASEWGSKNVKNSGEWWRRVIYAIYIWLNTFSIRRRRNCGKISKPMWVYGDDWRARKFYSLQTRTQIHLSWNKNDVIKPLGNGHRHVDWILFRGMYGIFFKKKSWKAGGFGFILNEMT